MKLLKRKNNGKDLNEMKVSSMSKRIMAVLVAGVMMTGVLAGCGSSSGDGSMSGTIDVVSREDGSGTRGAFVELTGILTESNGNKTDNTTVDAIIANQTEVMMQNVAGDEYGIGYASMGSLNDSVKAVKIEGVDATAANVQNGTYAISRPFNIVLNGDAKGVAADFINYILSAEGQKVISDAGYIQVDTDAKAFESDGSTGTITVAGSSSVTPVMEKLKEAYEKVNTGAKITIEESDSTTGINSTKDGICDIGMASRALSDDEAKELKSIQIALDGIAVIVNPSNTVEDLTLDQVRQIYTGEITDWADVTK